MHVPRRAAQLEHQDISAPIHPTGAGLLQEVDEPRGGDRLVCRPLQLLPPALDLAVYAGYGGGTGGPLLDLGRIARAELDVLNKCVILDTQWRPVRHATAAASTT